MLRAWRAAYVTLWTLPEPSWSPANIIRAACAIKSAMSTKPSGPSSLHVAGVRTARPTVAGATAAAPPRQRHCATAKHTTVVGVSRINPARNPISTALASATAASARVFSASAAASARAAASTSSVKTLSCISWTARYWSRHGASLSSKVVSAVAGADEEHGTLIARDSPSLSSEDESLQLPISHLR